MKNLIFTFALLLLVFNCSSEDDTNDPNNIAPGPFSVTILETRMDGASIEWTEAIDIDDDPVTYSIYLDDQLISTGTTALSYNFTGLTPETVYEGTIIADDGRGGHSQDDFFFLTEPETLILTINASDWIYESYPEAGGTREIRGAGFEIPFYENATAYQIEIIDFSITFIDGVTVNDSGTYSWTNENRNDPIYVLNANGNYVVYLASASVNTISSGYQTYIDYITSRAGTAQVIITF
ncbi:fibronectin type III domain-containing protein [Psychroserpens sp. Hel_I_66]|uniref:fibronectin type III domain-containing protein n=1 Tax=Psychroserpens sp. Hel_I_66 TaxID=1250004 RepID=UPI0006460802|nr:fibronectin type III domain-containing protein [Psychroserpens sp. Hel_I_66]